MNGEFWVVNSDRSLTNAIEHLRSVFSDKKYARVKIDAGKRTLDQNALKSVWYGLIAKHRGDVTAKDVERECKLNYGLSILRRDPARNWVYEKSVDMLPYEKKLRVMDSFAVTSIMTVLELREYLAMMQSDYPFLDSNRVHYAN